MEAESTVGVGSCFEEHGYDGTVVVAYGECEGCHLGGDDVVDIGTEKDEQAYEVWISHLHGECQGRVLGIRPRVDVCSPLE